jgi:hypothetical protein
MGRATALTSSSAPTGRREEASSSSRLVDAMSSALRKTPKINKKEFLAQLLSSPLGFFSDFSEDELLPLVKLMKATKFSNQQRLPRSAIYYVTSGKVAIKTTSRIDGTERRIEKGAGEWFFNTAAMTEADWDPMNFLWAYTGVLPAESDAFVGMDFDMRASNMRETQAAPRKRFTDPGVLVSAGATRMRLVPCLNLATARLTCSCATTLMVCSRSGDACSAREIPSLITPCKVSQTGARHLGFRTPAPQMRECLV